MAEVSLEFGRELRRLRTKANISQQALGERVKSSKGTISKIESGLAKARLDFARRCDDTLGAGGALMALVPANQRSKRKQSRRDDALVGLPPSTEHFVGRSRELAVLSTFVKDDRGTNVFLVTGMAGVGKTALALNAAWKNHESFPDGCLFLDFRTHTPNAPALDEHRALGDLLRLLNVPGEEMPSDRSGRVNLYQSRLRGRRMLLILDNVGTTDQIRSLIPAESGCRVVVTSRHRLNSLDEASHISMDVLSDDEATALFRSIGGRRAEEATASVLNWIVEYCGRLPLAIRIVAARFRGNPRWTLEDFQQAFAEEVSRLDVIDDGERSVEATLTMSCNSLGEHLRRLLGLLALHPGREIRLSGIAALTGASLARTRMWVDRLSDAHLVTYETADRVIMHDLLREFARDRLLPETAVEEREAAFLRLLDHSLLVAESCGRLIEPHRHRVSSFSEASTGQRLGITSRSEAVEWFQSEWPSLVELCRTAAARGLHRRCWQLAFALRDYFFLAKLWEPWIDTHHVAIASARAAGADDVLAVALNNLGIAHVDRGDLNSALGHYREALTLFQRLQDEHGQTSATSNIAWVFLYLGDYGRSLHELRKVLDAYRRLGNPRNAAITLRAIALVETELALYREAVEHGTEALGEFQALDLPLDVVMSINCIAWAHFNSGAFDTAAVHYERAAVLGHRCGSRYETVRAITGLGNIAAASGRLDEADALWAQADALHQPLEPTVIGEARLRSWMRPNDKIPEVTGGPHGN